MKTYPKGTTAEQWEEYEKSFKKHEQYIRDYKFFLGIICANLRLHSPDYLWRVDDIEKFMSKEIDKAHSMDAPNKPGYYRANND